MPLSTSIGSFDPAQGYRVFFNDELNDAFNRLQPATIRYDTEDTMLAEPSQPQPNSGIADGIYTAPNGQAYKLLKRYVCAVKKSAIQTIYVITLNKRLNMTSQREYSTLVQAKNGALYDCIDYYERSGVRDVTTYQAASNLLHHGTSLDELHSFLVHNSFTETAL